MDIRTARPKPTAAVVAAADTRRKKEQVLSSEGVSSFHSYFFSGPIFREIGSKLGLNYLFKFLKV